MYDFFRKHVRVFRTIKGFMYSRISVLLEKVTHTWANDDHTMEFETLGLEHV